MDRRKKLVFIAAAASISVLVGGHVVGSALAQTAPEDGNMPQVSETAPNTGAAVESGEVPNSAGPGQPEDPMDPVAAEIAEKSAKFLAAQPAFSFSWFVSYDEVADGHEKLTYLRSGDTLMVRGKGFVSHSEQEGELRDYYYDGSEFTVVSPDEHFYASAPFNGGFDALVAAVRDHTDTILPLWTMMSPTLPDTLLDGVERGAYLGETLVAGHPAYHLAFSQRDEDWQVWISTNDDQPLPLMLVGTDKNQKGWPQYRVYMTDWNLDPDQAPAQFKFTPSDQYDRITLPSLMASGKAGGSEAPGSAEPPAKAMDGGTTEAPDKSSTSGTNE